MRQLRYQANTGAREREGDGYISILIFRNWYKEISDDQAQNDGVGIEGAGSLFKCFCNSKSSFASG